MSIFRGSILILFAFVLTAAASNDNACEQARLQGNRYFGATRASLKSGAITLADLQQALRSAEPYDPLAQVTPEKHQIVAKHLFAEMAKDPKVRAQWNETKDLITRLLSEEFHIETVRAEAERVTRNVLAPHEIYSVASVPQNSSIVFAHLPDGRDVLARTDENNRELIVTTVNGQPVLRKSLPVPSNKMEQWKFGWHADQTGQLWLYASVACGDFENRRWMSNYRLKWGAEAFESIPNKVNFEVAPDYFHSIGAHMILIATNGMRFEMTGEKALKIDSTAGKHPQSVAIDNTGKLVNRSGETNASEIVYTTLAGNTFQFTGTGVELYYRGINDFQVKTIDATCGRSHALLATEADGRLLLAQITNAGADGVGAVRVYAPLESNKPIFVETFPHNTLSPSFPRLHWLTGPRGETLLGFASANTLYFADPLGDTMLHVSLARHQFGTWFSSGGRTYYRTRNGDSIHIYDIFAEVPR